MKRNKDSHYKAINWNYATTAPKNDSAFLN